MLDVVVVVVVIVVSGSLEESADEEGLEEGVAALAESTYNKFIFFTLRLCFSSMKTLKTLKFLRGKIQW